MADIKWDNLYRVLNEYADFWIKKAQEHMEENGNVASGELIRTMGAQREISFNDGKVSVKISMLHYWKYIEEGTGPQHKPDARSQYFPPIGAIRKWVQVKPVLPQTITLKDGTHPTDKQLPYVIQSIIHKYGTKAHPFFEQTKDEAYQQFEKAIAIAITDDLLENYRNETKNVL